MATQKDLRVSAIILIPIFIFLFVWVVACGFALADDSMINMDKGIIVFFLILGFFTIKKLFLSLVSIKKMYIHSQSLSE